jgi:hypothetical protein
MAKLPLPDEQPIPVSALRNMRSRIAGEIAMHSPFRGFWGITPGTWVFSAYRKPSTR